MRKQNGEGGAINLKPEVLNFNLRNNLRKTDGEGLIRNLRFYLRKTRAEGGGLEMFLQRENIKNFRYFLTVP